jgi:hypothetical protein
MASPALTGRSIGLLYKAKQMKDVPNAGIIDPAAGTFVPAREQGAWGSKRFVSPSDT